MRLSGGQRIRTSALRSENSCLDFPKRKIRSGITFDETKTKQADDFWISPMVSRTSSNKEEVKRSRLGPHFQETGCIHSQLTNHILKDLDTLCNVTPDQEGVTESKQNADTPAKPARKAVIVASTNDKSPKVNTTDHSAGYTLNKNKAIRQKLDASNRTFSVVPEFSPGNLVLTFTAGAYEEFKIVSLSVLQGQGLSIRRTNTTDVNRAEVDEIENNLTLQYICSSCKTLKSLQSDLLVSQLKHAPDNTGIQPTTSIRSRSENSDTSINSSHLSVPCTTPPRLTNRNLYPIPVSISATPTTTCNNTNILEEEIKDLKSQLGLKD
ncbi:unnamed protein product [Mytilus coruscus]|uniref:Uncharacterized protein n=1 Tax=Mytilus coruscus TaxID=42192 RepID=A0A6J8ABS5_MYTCO|nr:unnamed protein product [Mytilus coruscus]